MHLHPKKVSAESITFSRTFGLGGVNALLFVILTITGILLRFSYSPAVTEAYDSIVYLQKEVLFGRWLRNIHHFSAHLMVATSFLHLVRVYYSHALYGKRAKNWVYGMLLFLLVLFFNFTGYLLPWDSLSFWAVTVMTQMLDSIPFIGHHLANALRGGESVNGATLLLFYNLHTGILPMLVIALMSLHFWLVRKAGGVAIPIRETREMLDCRRHLVPREVLLALVIITSLLFFSALFDAPLEQQANPAVSPNPNKAPWYFLGVQELLLHLDPLFSAFIIPALMMVLFFALPFFKYKKINTGSWFHSGRGRILTIESCVFSFAFTFLLIVALEYLIRPSAFILSLPPLIGNGILPLLLYLLPVGIFVYLKHQKRKMERVEWLQVLISIVFSSYVVMMLTAYFLRGKGMQLFSV